MFAGEPIPDRKRANTYPEALAEIFGRLNYGSHSEFVRCGVDELYDHLVFDVKTRTRISTELMKEEDRDMFVVVYTATDAAGQLTRSALWLNEK